MVCVMRVRAVFERLIPHLSACCAFGLDGEEVAGRGVVFQAPGFHTSAVQVNRSYTMRLPEFVEIRRFVLDGLTLPT